MKTLKLVSNNKAPQPRVDLTNQVTQQGAKTIEVIIRDAESKMQIAVVCMKRALLAKYMHEQKVFANNGKWIVEV